MNCEHKCGPSLTGGVCYCPAGRSLASDNRSCTDLDECAEWGHCDQLCANTDGSYSCSCAAGYTLVDRSRCIASNTGSLELIFAHDTAIVRMSAHGQDSRNVANATGASGIAYHHSRNLLFWSDTKTRKVQSIPLNEGTFAQLKIFRFTFECIVVYFIFDVKSMHFDISSNFFLQIENITYKTSALKLVSYIFSQIN